MVQAGVNLCVTSPIVRDKGHAYECHMLFWPPLTQVVQFVAMSCIARLVANILFIADLLPYA